MVWPQLCLHETSTKLSSLQRAFRRVLAGRFLTQLCLLEILTFCLPVLSAHNLGKQFGPRSFLKEFFQKLFLKKSDDKKARKLPKTNAENYFEMKIMT